MRRHALLPWIPLLILIGLLCGCDTENLVEPTLYDEDDVDVVVTNRDVPIEIEFSLAASSSASIAVYEPSGKLVRDLAKGMFAAGVHTVQWDYTDDDNHSVDDGIYLLAVYIGGIASLSGEHVYKTGGGDDPVETEPVVPKTNSSSHMVLVIELKS